MFDNLGLDYWSTFYFNRLACLLVLSRRRRLLLFLMLITACTTSRSPEYLRRLELLLTRSRPNDRRLSRPNRLGLSHMVFSGAHEFRVHIVILQHLLHLWGLCRLVLVQVSHFDYVGVFDQHLLLLFAQELFHQHLIYKGVRFLVAWLGWSGVGFEARLYVLVLVHDYLSRVLDDFWSLNSFRVDLNFDNCQLFIIIINSTTSRCITTFGLQRRIAGFHNGILAYLRLHIQLRVLTRVLLHLLWNHHFRLHLHTLRLMMPWVRSWVEYLVWIYWVYYLFQYRMVGVFWR